MKRLTRACLGLAVCLTLAASQSFAQGELAGAPGGELKTFAIPAKGILTGVMVYGDTSVDGLVFEYRTEADFPSTKTQSPVFGAAVGKSTRIQIPKRLPIKQAVLSWGNSLSSIQLEWDGQTGPVESAGTVGAQQVELSFPADSKIVGARIRADASRVYAIAFDTAAGHFGPPPGVTLTIAKPTETVEPAADNGEFEFAGDAPITFEFAGTWQTAMGEAGSVSLIADNSSKTPVPLSGNMKDNCIECASYNSPAVIRVMPLDKAGRQIRIRFDRFPGQEAILTRQSQDGKTAGGANSGPTWMVIGGGMTAIFYKFDDGVGDDGNSNAPINWRLELTTIASQPVSGKSSTRWVYQRSLPFRHDTEAEKLKAINSDAEPEAKTSVDSAYTTNSVVGGYAYLLGSYDATNVDLMTPNKGVKQQVFADPPPTKWDINRFLADPKVVPRGIIAVNRIQHATRYSQNALSTVNEVHKELGYNFGTEAGPMGAAIGISFSQTQASGLSSAKDTMMALGVSRSTNYALLLDKSEIRLTNDFKQSVRQYLMPANATDKDYEDFIETFGTHYANAVTYGGMGVATETFGSDSFITWAEKSMSVNTSIGGGERKTGPHGSISGGVSKSSGSSDSTLISFDDKAFDAVGGVGVNEHSFSVPLQSSVPILYDLRPLSELVSGLWFNESDDQLFRVRRGIDAAIERHFGDHPPPPPEPSRVPRAYKLEIVNLYCREPVDGEENILLRYRAWVSYTDDRTANGKIEIINASDGDIKMKCDNRTPYAINKSMLLWRTALGATPPSLSADLGTLVAFKGDTLGVGQRLWSSDDGGKQGPSWPATNIAKASRWTEGEFQFTGGKVTFTFGNTAAIPKMRLTYRVQQIQ